MTRTRFDEARDQRIADEQTAPVGFTPEQMCVANACPNRWAVDAGVGKLCSAHAWADPNRWPEITQHQQWDETDRARSASKPHAEPLSAADKRAIIAKLGALAQHMRDNGGVQKAWARRLKWREEAGERLNSHQRAAWRQALSVEQREPVTMDEAQADGLRVE